jgi:hypothetical protein
LVVEPSGRNTQSLYVSAFSGKTSNFAAFGQSEILGYPTDKIRNQLVNIFNDLSGLSLISYMKENNLKYLYLNVEQTKTKGINLSAFKQLYRSETAAVYYLL